MGVDQFLGGAGNDHFIVETSELNFDFEAGSDSVNFVAYDPICVFMDPIPNFGWTYANRPVNPMDVDGDGAVSPTDATSVLDALKSGGRKLTDRDSLGFHLDVNADGYISPLDALIVINQLNGHGQVTEVPPPVPMDCMHMLPMPVYPVFPMPVYPDFVLCPTSIEISEDQLGPAAESVANKGFENQQLATNQRNSPPVIEDAKPIAITTSPDSDRSNSELGTRRHELAVDHVFAKSAQTDI